PDDTPAAHRCLDCGAMVSGRFCSSCGAPTAPERLTVKHVTASAAEHFLSIDAPMVKTFVDLLRYPGKVAARYAAGSRKTYTNPFKYNLLAGATTVAILLAITHGQIGQAAATKPTSSHVQQVVMQASAMMIRWNTDYLQFIYFGTLPLLAAF